MLILGINGCLSPSADDFMPRRWPLHFHDASAVLVEDGAVVAGIEQERLNRIKHTTRFAGDAVRFCLRAAGAKLRDVDRVAYFVADEYVDRELYQHYAQNPGLPALSCRELLADRLREYCDDDLPRETFEFVQHHTAHAFSTYPQSGYPDALVVVMDGAGEAEAISVYDARGAGMDLVFSKEIPASLGFLYRVGTELLGYRMFDEYKVMGLAPHGDPRTYRQVFDSLYDLREGGDFELAYADLQPAFGRTGFPMRRKGERFSQAHKDFAAGLQEMLENIAWHVISHWQRETRHRRLALAGGVAQNCTLNGRLLRGGMFEDVFVHPASHDAGTSLGAALKVQADLGGPLRNTRLRQVFWGPELPAGDDVECLLHRWSAFVTVDRSADVERDTALLLSQDKVVGWAQGRSEFGPRALGNRSILADPRPEANRDRVNLKVKQRETFRPFAPSVRAEDLRDYFEYPEGMMPPDFMVFTVPVHPDKRRDLGAVTHVDGTARVHAVDREVNPRFWRLLTEFKALTGVPVLLNTSFNNQAEPIVDTAEDALRCFLTTRIDHLVIGDLIVSKRPWTLADLAALRPVIAPAARLHTETSPAGQPTHTITHDHIWGEQRPISQTVHSVLAHADGTHTLRELGATTEPVLTLIQDLWNDRYLDLTPA